MTTDRTPNTRPSNARPRLWLALAAVIAAVSIAILWPLQAVGQVCILIYPAPPGCGADEPRWVPLVAIGIIIALLAAIVVIYVTVPRPRTLVIVLTGVIILVLAIGAAVVGISQTGIWDPYQPYVIVD